MTAPGKERVGDYELLDLIGDGSQGRVYKARYCGEDASRLAQEEIVAAKLIRITGDDDKLRTKFQAQADILRRLSHNNIVRYRDSFAWHAGEWDEAQCLVMEFLEGEPLSDRLKKANTGLPWSQVEGIFEQCLAGLIHARERGITHRDIKPSNLFITTEGQAKVIDFDIARRDDSGQMSTAGWKGTFDYMAPDFITIPGFRGDELSDIFSLGVCFYQALTGVLPYESLGDSAHIGYLNRWRDGAAPSPSFRPGVFRVLSNAKPFVAKCLAAKREQRYQTFATMLEDFRKIRARRIRHKNKEEYELLAVLGRGGFGEVFKARKISDGSLVAVKHLFAEKQSERFIKEAKILQQYPHPNLCKYVDFMVVEGTAGEKQYFLILEFLEGMPGWTLRTRLKNEGRLEAAEAMPLFVGYLSALQFLHENSRPIIHRDIKPGNLYAPVGQPENGKIFDLGVARDVSGTVTVGGIPGTLDYMPPEFAEVGGDRGSPQSDIYALGLCLYESLAGRPVHERLPTDLNSAWLAFQKRLRKPLELTFESDAFRQYPRLRAVILKSLAARSVDRYRSAAEMRKDLEDILAGKGYDDVNADEANLEMTNATLHSFAEDDVLHAPEPGATQATRPLDGMGVTQLAPEGLLAAGKAEAERRKRRKRVITVSAIAAGTLAVMGIGGWLISGMIARSAATTAQKMEQAIQGVEQAVGEMKDPVPSATYVRSLGQAYEEAVRTGRKYPELGSRIDEQCRMMRKAGVALPAEFKRSFDAALTADKTEKAAKILKEWETLAAFADIMGITAQQFGERREAMKNTMARSDIQRELAALRQVIPETVLDDSSLDKGEAAAGRLKALRDRPWPGYDEGEKQQQLGALASTLSDRTMPYIAGLRDAALGRYRAGQDGDSERDALIHFGETNPALSWVIQASYLDARNSVETARQSRLVAGGLRKVLDHAASARDLAGVQAVVSELAALEKASGGRIPPTQIKSAEEALSAKYLFIAEGYAQGAKSAFDSGKADEAEKAQRELVTLIAVTPDRFGKSALVGLLQDVEGRRVVYLTRQSDALALQRKAKLQAEEAARKMSQTPTTKEVAPPPVVQAITGRPPEKVVAGLETHPAQSVVNQSVSKGKGALDIRVSPKTAIITVDGTVATSGRIEVTPDENHKVMVEAPGYKECLQYYKVRAGETRKIDILLEKMVKKSFFGL